MAIFVDASNELDLTYQVKRAQDARMQAIADDGHEHEMTIRAHALELIDGDVDGVDVLVRFTARRDRAPDWFGARWVIGDIEARLGAGGEDITARLTEGALDELAGAAIEALRA